LQPFLAGRDEVAHLCTRGLPLRINDFQDSGAIDSIA
jgi:hypothetical protein